MFLGRLRGDLDRFDEQTYANLRVLPVRSSVVTDRTKKLSLKAIRKYAEKRPPNKQIQLRLNTVYSSEIVKF